MSVRRIRKNDMVIVTSGDDKGSTGKVLEVLPERNGAIVEGLNVVKKTLKKTRENPKGGVVSREAPIVMSSLMPYCPACKKGVRLRSEREGDRNVRKCRACGHAFDR